MLLLVLSMVLQAARDEGATANAQPVSLASLLMKKVVTKSSVNSKGSLRSFLRDGDGWGNEISAQAAKRLTVPQDILAGIDREIKAMLQAADHLDLTSLGTGEANDSTYRADPAQITPSAEVKSEEKGPDAAVPTSKTLLTSSPSTNSKKLHKVTLHLMEVFSTKEHITVKDHSRSKSTNQSKPSLENDNQSTHDDAPNEEDREPVVTLTNQDDHDDRASTCDTVSGYPELELGIVMSSITSEWDVLTIPGQRLKWGKTW